MAVTAKIYELTGTGTGVDKTESVIRFKNADNADVDLNDPIDCLSYETVYSYTKQLQFYFDITEQSTVSDLTFYINRSSQPFKYSTYTPDYPKSQNDYVDILFKTIAKYEQNINTGLANSHKYREIFYASYIHLSYATNIFGITQYPSYEFAINFIIGTTYKLSFDVVGAFSVLLTAAGSLNTYVSGDGHFEFEFVAKTMDNLVFGDALSNHAGSFSNIHLYVQSADTFIPMGDNLIINSNWVLDSWDEVSTGVFTPHPVPIQMVLAPAQMNYGDTLYSNTTYRLSFTATGVDKSISIYLDGVNISYTDDVIYLSPIWNNETSSFDSVDGKYEVDFMPVADATINFRSLSSSLLLSNVVIKETVAVATNGSVDSLNRYGNNYNIVFDKGNTYDSSDSGLCGAILQLQMKIKSGSPDGHYSYDQSTFSYDEQ